MDSLSNVTIDSNGILNALFFLSLNYFKQNPERMSPLCRRLVNEGETILTSLDEVLSAVYEVIGKLNADEVDYLNLKVDVPNHTAKSVEKTNPSSATNQSLRTTRKNTPATGKAVAPSVETHDKGIVLEGNTEFQSTEKLPAATRTAMATNNLSKDKLDPLSSSTIHKKIPVAKKTATSSPATNNVPRSSETHTKPDPKTPPQEISDPSPPPAPSSEELENVKELFVELTGQNGYRENHLRFVLKDITRISDYLQWDIDDKTESGCLALFKEYVEMGKAGTPEIIRMSSEGPAIKNLIESPEKIEPNFTKDLKKAKNDFQKIGDYKSSYRKDRPQPLVRKFVGYCVENWYLPQTELGNGGEPEHYLELFLQLQQWFDEEFGEDFEKTVQKIRVPNK